jgi:alpha-mannosidase
VQAPYPYPATHKDGTAPKYNTVNAMDVAASGIGKGKINVHLVPHTHDDTGWLVTVDQYFFSEVYYVVDTVVDNLVKDPKRHFIYVETGFFARWWDEQPDERRNVTKALVKSGQLEFINGAWCMHDEASPFYVEMVDQTTRGHQFLRKNFGEDAIPRGTWQIDPFGHSNTEAWLLGEEAGFESLFWGRTDYQDMAWRTSPGGKAKNQWPEWVWQGSQSLGKSAELLAGQLTVHGYGAPISWNTDGGAIQDNPSRHDYNLDELVDSFIKSAETLAGQNVGRLGHQLWPCGSDFQCASLLPPRLLA